MKGRGLRGSACAALLVACASVLSPATPAAGAAGAASLHLQEVGSFDFPRDIDGAPGARHLLFVVERSGRIAVLRRGHLLSHPFLDAGGLMTVTDQPGPDSEFGLLSLAFDPNYARNHRFYIAYTNQQGDIEVDMFKRRLREPAQARPRSRRTVIVVDHQQGTYHFGGQLQFDRKGRLYLSTGDGGPQGDPEGDAQNPDDLLGKLLRIVPTPGGGYDVPEGNPFVGHPGADEILSLGLRNPWRFSIDQRSDQLWIGDVGWTTEEEVDHSSLRGANGANFGWNPFEGDSPCTPCGSTGVPPPNYVPPVLAYEHGPGCAVVGGYVAHDRELPSLRGEYVYADYCTGDIRVLDPARGTDRSTGLAVTSPTSFGKGSRQRLYVATLDGPVYRIAPGP